MKSKIKKSFYTYLHVVRYMEMYLKNLNLIWVIRRERDIAEGPENALSQFYCWTESIGPLGSSISHRFTLKWSSALQAIHVSKFCTLFPRDKVNKKIKKLWATYATVVTVIADSTGWATGSPNLNILKPNVFSLLLFLL